MAQHNNFGKEGENIAADYLLDKGYHILERNWRFKHKEIDLIAMHHNYLIIIEVKTRKNEHFESPKEAITNGKIKLIIEATEAYILEKNILEEVRFDVITLIPDNLEWKIEHIEEAFHPTL